MNNLLQYLKQNKKQVTLNPLSNDNRFIHREVADLLEYADDISHYFNENPLMEIASVDQYVDYFSLKKIISFKKYVKNMEGKPDKEKLSSLIEEMRRLYIRIQPSELIDFINVNYKALFSVDDNQRYVQATYDTCAKYQEHICNEVLLYMINHYSYKVLYDYDRFQNSIEKDSRLFNTLFSKEHVKLNLAWNPDYLREVIKSLQKRKKGTLCNELQELAEVCAVQLQEYDACVGKEREVYCMKKEEGYLEEIQGVEVLNYVNSQRDQGWKLLIITHSKRENQWSPYLNKSLAHKLHTKDKDALTIATKNYYTLTNQKELSAVVDRGGAKVELFLVERALFCDSIHWYTALITSISKCYGCNEKELKEEFSLLFQMLQNIYWESDKNNMVLQQSLCYAAATFICGYMEKLLRTVYQELKKEEQYIAITKVTLGQLLSDGNMEFRNIFGQYQLKHLRYFLLTDDEQKIGLNYRNNLAHWVKIETNKLDRALVTRLLYLLTSIMNSLVYNEKS